MGHDIIHSEPQGISVYRTLGVPQLTVSMMISESLEAHVGDYRLAPYLKACQGNRDGAAALYLWNVEVSSSFWTPLSLVEIALRNAISEAFRKNLSEEWCLFPQQWMATEDAKRLDQIRSRLRARGVTRPTVDQVAHHSPIFHRDLNEMLATVESLGRIIDPALGVFIQENQSVSELLGRRP